MKQTLLLSLLLLSFGLFAQTDDEIEQQIAATLAQDTTEIEIIPIITLNENDLANDQDEGVFGLLTASKDVFVRITDFNLSAARFRFRGYDSENTQVYYNGVPTNDLESGWAGWSSWGGLNDMTRRQETNTGLEAMGYSFGTVGGAINIDTRASSQRKQVRLTMTRTNNGNYNNRAMLSYSTGMQENGWAFAAMASRRWAEEGYISGTFYEGYGYFLSIDKKLGDKDLINFQVLGSPNTRGKSGASFQEMYDLSNDNFYNPYWGYQNGEKRNSRVATRHQPMAVLRWDKKFNDKLSLTTAANYQTGRNGSTSLDWYKGNDPRPDYYRKLPSFVDDNQVSERLELERLLGIEENRQIDWQEMYDINRLASNAHTVENVAGIAGNSISGQRSQYMVLDRRYDSDRVNINTNLTAIVNDKLTVSSGLSFQDYTGHNYQQVEDLLGGDYYLDVDKFAERDFDVTGDEDPFIQSDLNNPVRVVTEGDRFGYDYDSNIQKSNAWVQGEWSNGALSLFGAVEASNTRFWRTGNYRNGKFPENSFGDSEKQSFLNYGLKGGASYGLNGRNYLVGNVYYGTRAPYFRNAYVSHRTRDELVPNLSDEKILSLEGAYFMTAPGRKLKIGGYFTTFENQTDIIRFYNDIANTFGSYVMSGINTQHAGIETAFEIDIPMLAGLSAQGAASIGQYIYTNRFPAQIFVDNIASITGGNDRLIYAENFFVPGNPQTAGTFGLQYQTSNYLTFNVNLNYFDDIWLGFNPERRTERGVQPISDFSTEIFPDTPEWDAVVHQQKTDEAFTLDISVRKSFKIKNDYFINFNLGVDNILNNTDFINGGFEQLRFDYVDKDVDRFQPRLYNARGITYFLNVAFSYRP